VCGSNTSLPKSYSLPKPKSVPFRSYPTIAEIILPFNLVYRPPSRTETLTLVAALVIQREEMFSYRYSRSEP